MTKWAYVFIGDGNTGKTTFQKELLYHVTGARYIRLDCNLEFSINARFGARNAQTISFMNRSIQEKLEDYKSVENFFISYFNSADIAILSTHVCKSDIEIMLAELKKRFYNVCGVFFQNSVSQNSQNEVISMLEWQERYFVKNPVVSDEADWNNMLEKSALEFAFHILNKN